jgi:sugar lactone lactonase YvrE
MGSMQNNVNPDDSASSIDRKDGVLYRLDPDASVSIHRTDIGISNTMSWSPDRKRLYFGDSLANTIWSYDYNPVARTISNERPFLKNFPRGLPDGSTVDSEGYLWNCRYYGGCIVRVAPDGRIDHVVEMPVKNMTTCTFGGQDRKTLLSRRQRPNRHVSSDWRAGSMPFRLRSAGDRKSGSPYSVCPLAALLADKYVLGEQREL